MRFATLSHQVVHELGLRIVRGDYQPGRVLPNEAELSSDFQVSRTVMREALKALAAKGLIRSRPRVGPVVQPQSAWEQLDSDILAWSTQEKGLTAFMDQLTEVRQIIEPDAARLTATRATPEELLHIVATFTAMEETIADPAAFLEHDLDFHEAIIKASHNDVLYALLGTLRKGLAASRLISTETLRQDAPETVNARATTLLLHREVLDALQAHDGQRAHDAMIRLLTTVHTAIGLMLDQEHTTDAP